MTLLAFIPILVASPSAPLGVKTAKVVANMDWAVIPSKDAHGQKQRLAIELRVRKMLPDPFPIHLRIPRAGLPANPPRLMLLREVDAKGQIKVKTACQWDAINERTAELTWFVPRSSAGVCRFVLDFSPAATEVVIGMQRAGGKFIYAAHKKATYTLNPVGARIEKLEIESLNPLNIAAGKGLDLVAGTESKPFKVIQELNGPLCYRVAALAESRLVKRITLYSGIYWHETEVHGKPARLVHHMIEIASRVTPRSAYAYRRDGLLLGVASISGPATIKTIHSGFDARAAGPFARFLTFAGIDENRTVALMTLERLIIAADAIDAAEARISVLR